MTTSTVHVSSRNKQAAKSAIVAKRELMARWATSGLPFKGGAEPKVGEPFDLDWYPQSLRDFCKWDGSQNSPALGPFQPTAAQTLSAYPEEKRQVIALIGALAKLEVATRRRLDPSEAVREAEGRLTLERQLRAGALLGYRAARTENRKLRSQLANEQRAHQQTIEQLQAQLRRVTAESTALRSENAELAATVRKVSPIRAVR